MSFLTPYNLILYYSIYLYIFRDIKEEIEQERRIQESLLRDLKNQAIDLGGEGVVKPVVSSGGGNYSSSAISAGNKKSGKGR